MEPCALKEASRVRVERLKKFREQHGPNLDEFDGVLFAGKGRDLLRQDDLHWEYGFRLLQLAVWRDVIRRYMT